MRILGLFLVTVWMAAAQCHSLGEVNAEKPEGQLLQQIGQESDAAKKLPLLEKFAAEFPKHEAAGWVYEQMLDLHIKGNNPDKAMEAAEKIVALPPDCPEVAHQGLKAAEAKKDPELIKKWSAVTADAAAKVANSAKPQDEDEVEDWKRRVDFAKQVSTYTEYSLYAAALQTADPAKKIDLIETLEQRNPQSQYLAQSAGALFMAYRQANQTAKAVALAEKVLATDQSNEDMLLVVADSYLQQKKDPDKVHAYSAKIVELVNSKPKPEGVSDADWANRRDTIRGIAQYMSGKLYYNQGRFPQADQQLRSALEVIDRSPALKPEVLYFLGFANYKMEKPQEAVNFYRACAALKSPVQGACSKNLTAIRSQYSGIK